MPDRLTETSQFQDAASSARPPALRQRRGQLVDQPLLLGASQLTEAVEDLVVSIGGHALILTQLCHCDNEAVEELRNLLAEGTEPVAMLAEAPRPPEGPTPSGR